MNRADERARMVEGQLVARDIVDARVLSAMGRVERERFVPDDLQEHAYEDRPLAIGGGQTISQPYMVALMCQLLALHGKERVLEVGAGSGYQTAVLAELARSVYAVEVRRELADLALRRLAILAYRNVEVACFDGSAGWLTHAPYDAIVVAAGAPVIPPLLVDQLSVGGRLVAPVGPHDQQRLAVVRRKDEGFDVEWSTQCIFVDLIGKYGWGGQGVPSA